MVRNGGVRSEGGEVIPLEGVAPVPASATGGGVKP